MGYETILNSKFTEPAAILSCRGEDVRILDVNERFLSELWMNIAKEEFLRNDLSANFEEDSFRIFKHAVLRCAKTGEEQTAENWWLLVSDCCGFNKVYLKSRIVRIEQNGDEAVIYVGVRNLTEEKKTKEDLSNIEYRYVKASEQINIYNWEYTVATKEMRPCYRCMRDLGLPALVEDYPEPAIEAGIFPADYADMYRAMMRRIDEGSPEEEADIPLTVGRVPFRVKYTTEFD